MCKELDPTIPGDESDWDFEGLVMVGKLEHTDERAEFREVPDACCAERRKVLSCVIKVLEIAASAGTARKKRHSYGALHRWLATSKRRAQGWTKRDWQCG